MYGSRDHIPIEHRNAGNGTFSALEVRDASSSELPLTTPLYKVCGTRMGGAHANATSTVDTVEEHSDFTTLSIIPSTKQIQFRYIVVTHQAETVPTTIFDQICAQHMVLQTQFERMTKLPGATSIQRVHFKGLNSVNVGIAALPINLRDQVDVVYATRAGTADFDVDTIGNPTLGQYAAANFRLLGADGQPTVPTQFAGPIADRMNVYILSFVTDQSGSGVNGVANFNSNTVFIDFDTLPLLGVDGQPAPNLYEPAPTLSFEGKVLCHELGHALGLPHAFDEGYPTSNYISDVPLRQDPDFIGGCGCRRNVDMISNPAGANLPHDSSVNLPADTDAINISGTAIISDNISGHTYTLSANLLQLSHQYFYNIMDYVPDEKKLQFTAGQKARMLSVTGNQAPKAAFLFAGPTTSEEQIVLTVPSGSYVTSSIIPLEIKFLTHFGEDVKLRIVNSETPTVIEIVILPFDRTSANPYLIDAQTFSLAETGVSLTIDAIIGASTTVSNTVVVNIADGANRPLNNLQLTKIVINPVAPITVPITVAEMKQTLETYFATQILLGLKEQIRSVSIDVVPLVIFADDADPMILTAGAEITILFFDDSGDPSQFSADLVTDLEPHFSQPQNMILENPIYTNFAISNGIGTNQPYSGMITITAITPTIVPSDETLLRARINTIISNNLTDGIFELGTYNITAGVITYTYSYLSLNTAKTPDEVRSELIRIRDLQSVEQWLTVDLQSYNGNPANLPTTRPGGLFFWEIKTVGITFGRTTPLITTAPIDLSRRASAEFDFIVTAAGPFSFDFNTLPNRQGLTHLIWTYNKIQTNTVPTSVIGSPDPQNYLIVIIDPTSANLKFHNVKFYETFSGATDQEISVLIAQMTLARSYFLPSGDGPVYWEQKYSQIETGNTPPGSNFPAFISSMVTPLVIEEDPDPTPDPDPDNDNSSWNRWWFWLIVALLIIVLVVAIYWMFFGWSRFW